jgi:hypothetical protein
VSKFKNAKPEGLVKVFPINVTTPSEEGDRLGVLIHKKVGELKMPPKAGTMVSSVCGLLLPPPPQAANSVAAPAAPKTVLRSIVMSKPQKRFSNCKRQKY